MHDQRHAHILPLYASFVSFNHLWMVMPYIEGGSALDVLQASFKDVRALPCTELAALLFCCPDFASMELCLLTPSS